MIRLIYGGSGSGKSAFAEEKAISLDSEKKYYIATMQIYDQESLKKVERHHNLRKGKGFETIEQPVDLSEIVNKINCNSNKRLVLLECMSNLVANEMFRNDRIVDSIVVINKIINEIEIVSKNCKELIIVSNNIFEDGIKYDKQTEDYLIALSELNKRIAYLADEVYEVVVGIPLRIK